MRKTRISRTGSLCATAGLILCALAADATAANILINGGFELPAQPSPTQDFTATGWTLTGGMQRANFANHTGNADPLQKSTPSGLSMWVKSFVGTGGRVQQDVGITSGANYAFSSWAWFETTFPTVTTTPGDPNDPTNPGIPGIDLTVGIEWLDSLGNAVGSPSSVTIDTDDPNAFGGATPLYVVNKWVPISFNATSPVGASQARVFGSWIGGRGVTGQQSAFIDDFSIDGPGTPPVASWGNNASGDWNIGTNWTTGSVPTGVDAVAALGSVITSAKTVYTDSAITLGTLRFNNANTYVVAGTGNLTMDVATGAALIDTLQGNHKINLPLRLNDNTTASVATGASLTIADPLTLANGSTLTKTGGGTMEIISTVTTVAGAATISTGAGTTNLRFQMGAGTSLANSGGETRTFTTQRVSAVTATGGTVAIDSAGATKVLVTDALTLSGAAKLDVGDNGVIVRGGNAAAIRAAITTGRVGGAGISSSAAFGNRGVGYANASDIGSPTTFLGEAFTGPAVLVRYTLLGDANLNGTVEFQDLVALAANYNSTGKQWFQADFDYDGDVDFQDLVPLASGYNNSVLSNGELTALGGADFAADFELARSLVPEPTSLLALGGLATVALRRRR